MTILFVYRYTLNDILSAYFVTYSDGVTTVRHFDGETNEIGEVVSSVPTDHMAEIQAHIEASSSVII